jgi:hypothetical protein
MSMPAPQPFPCAPAVAKAVSSRHRRYIDKGARQAMDGLQSEASAARRRAEWLPQMEQPEMLPVVGQHESMPAIVGADTVNSVSVMGPLAVEPHTMMLPCKRRQPGKQNVEEGS